MTRDLKVNPLEYAKHGSGRPLTKFNVSINLLILHEEFRRFKFVHRNIAFAWRGGGGFYAELFLHHCKPNVTEGEKQRIETSFQFRIHVLMIDSCKGEDKSCEI